LVGVEGCRLVGLELGRLGDRSEMVGKDGVRKIGGWVNSRDARMVKNLVNGVCSFSGVVDHKI
jgi:hypothetical protein